MVIYQEINKYVCFQKRQSNITGPKPLIFCGECDNSLALGALILEEI